jgi:hypothetical protein
VVSSSGRFVFRVWFPEPDSRREDVERTVRSMGGLTEWLNTKLLAVDAQSLALAQPVADYLAGEVESGYLMYETGRT